MFGSNKMTKVAIPERVYALCREVMARPMDDGTLKLRLEPKNLGGGTTNYGAVRTAAEELRLISTKENTISLAVEKTVMKSPEDMRRYINMNLENLKESLFYKVTQSYLELSAEVLKNTSVSKMSDTMGSNIGEKVTEDDMLAWRFWMPFLGFGYLHVSHAGAAGILLPNVAVFLKDILDSLNIKKQTTFEIDEFVSLISPYANVAIHNAVENKRFNYAFSNALRMLNDLGYIKAEHRLDAKEIWALYPYEGHELGSTITHVTIGGSK